MSEAAVKALFLPFEQGVLDPPVEGGCCFVNAEPYDAAGFPSPRCLQPWKGKAEALASRGLSVSTDDPAEEGFDLVLVLPGKGRDEACCDLARAFRLARPGAVVVAAVENSAGAGRIQQFFSRLSTDVSSLSKYKSRVFWTRKPDWNAEQRALYASWLDFATLRPVGENGEWLSRPGLFSWDRIDAGSRFLIDILERESSGKGKLKGKGADLGCGYGFLSATILRAFEKTRVTAIDADQRAVEAAERNLAPFIQQGRASVLWHDIASVPLNGRFDWIVSNPPFHEGRETKASLGARFIAAAAAALMPNGVFWMVGNRHLPYEKVIGACFSEWDCPAEQDGFKIIRARKGKGGRHGRFHA